MAFLLPKPILLPVGILAVGAQPSVPWVDVRNPRVASVKLFWPCDPCRRGYKYLKYIEISQRLFLFAVRLVIEKIDKFPIGNLGEGFESGF